MADHTVIRHQLDLVLHLVDTTTGSLLTGVGARFFCGGKPLHFLSKGDGHLLLMGGGAWIAAFRWSGAAICRARSTCGMRSFPRSCR